MTAETNDAPATDLAMAPCRALARVARVAMAAKANNFAHMKATMLSLRVIGMPAAVKARWISVQRVRSLAVQLTEGGHIDLHRRLDDIAIGLQHGVDGRHPTENLARAKALGQRRDMLDAVEKGQNGGTGTDRGMTAVMASSKS